MFWLVTCFTFPYPRQLCPLRPLWRPWSQHCGFVSRSLERRPYKFHCESCVGTGMNRLFPRGWCKPLSPSQEPVLKLHHHMDMYIYIYDFVYIYVFTDHIYLTSSIGSRIFHPRCSKAKLPVLSIRTYNWKVFLKLIHYAWVIMNTWTWQRNRRWIASRSSKNWHLGDEFTWIDVCILKKQVLLVHLRAGNSLKELSKVWHRVELSRPHKVTIGRSRSFGRWNSNYPNWRFKFVVQEHHMWCLGRTRCLGVVVAPRDLIAESWMLTIRIHGTYAWVLRTGERCNYLVCLIRQPIRTFNLSSHHEISAYIYNICVYIYILYVIIYAYTCRSVHSFFSTLKPRTHTCSFHMIVRCISFVHPYLCAPGGHP